MGTETATSISIITPSGGDVRFTLKFNRRGRIAELILGDVVASKPDPELARSALRALTRVVRQHRFVTILIVALNRHSRDGVLLRELRRALFFRLRPEIYFIVRDLGGFPDSRTRPAGRCCAATSTPGKTGA